MQPEVLSKLTSCLAGHSNAAVSAFSDLCTGISPSSVRLQLPTSPSAAGTFGRQHFARFTNADHLSPLRDPLLYPHLDFH